MDFTLEQARKIHADHLKIEKSIFEMGRKIAGFMKYKRAKDFSERYVSFDGVMCEAHFEDYCCGDTDYVEIKFPFLYFSMLDAEVEKDVIRRVEEEKQKQKEEQDNKNKLREEQRERARTVVIKEGWLGAGRKGEVVGPPVQSNTSQEWTPVLWDDEEDPEMFKTAGLQRLYPEDYELLKKGFI